MRKTVVIMLVASALAGCNHSSGLWGDDEFEHYTARVDGVTMDAGDGNRRNIAMQTDHPAPNYAYDKRIAVSAERMVKSVECLNGSRPANRTSTTNSVGIVGGTPVASQTTTQKNDC